MIRTIRPKIMIDQRFKFFRLYISFLINAIDFQYYHLDRFKFKISYDYNISPDQAFRSLFEICFFRRFDIEDKLIDGLFFHIHLWKWSYSNLKFTQKVGG